MKKLIVFLLFTFTFFGFKFVNADYIKVNTLPGYYFDFILYSRDEFEFSLYASGDVTNYDFFYLINTSYIPLNNLNSCYNYNYLVYNPLTNKTLISSAFCDIPIESINLYYSTGNNIINGTCGTNAKTYSGTTTSYTGTFCATGTQNPTTPNFPLPGQTINWTCQGSNSGTSASCSAIRESLSNAPINLKQHIKLPEAPTLDPQEIGVGAKVGKYQSGSGIVLNANVSNTGASQVRLAVDVYELGNTIPTQRYYSNYFSSGTGEVIIPYEGLGDGEYFWKVRTERNDGAMSDFVDYNTNYPWEYDFSYFSGFEPYPYGYKFVNSGPANGVLSGGVFNTPIFPLVRFKIEGNKWDLFNLAFDTSGFNDHSPRIYDAFESIGLNKKNALQGGNCYGMSVSSLMQLTHTGFLQTYYPTFSNQVGTGTIWYKINEPNTIQEDGYSRWSQYNDVLKTIYSLQVSYDSTHQINYIKASSTSSGSEILTKYNSNPNKKYILLFAGENSSSIFSHAVVPYKVVGNKIYFWDNIFPYTSSNQYLGYNQYMEVNSNGTVNIPSHNNYNFSLFALIDIDEIYNGGQKTPPIGFNNTDATYTLSGSADLYLEDSLGRKTGFLNGNILEEIPGTNAIIPYNGIGESGNTWKKIYLPQKQNLLIKVVGKSNEAYDLMIAGGDYYSKIDGVKTSSGEIDNYLSNRENFKIDFDDSKSGDYNLLIDNFYNNGTGTIYMYGMPSIGEKQKYDIDWTKVVNNDNDSVAYSMDIDNDGDYENKQDLPPIYQYVIPTMMRTSQPTSTLEEESEEK